MSEINSQTKPFELFKVWMSEAQADNRIKEATAMSLATANADGDLHVRVVLCKDWSEPGFTFFTNYGSRKGLDLIENPKAAVVFYWDPVFKQIKITGTTQKTSRADSEAYWNSRPRASQLSQFISKQSQPVGSRADLEKAWQDAEKTYAGKDIPCPGEWGGYVLIPESFEFWIGQPGRLHDRHEFKKSKANSTWTYQRLYP